MNRYDERRPRSWRHERNDDERYRREDYEFREDDDSGRTAGDSEHQPFSGNPYGYYPGQGEGGQRREWRDPRGEMRGRGGDRWPEDRGSQRYGSSHGGSQPYGGSSSQHRGSQSYGGGSSQYRGSQTYGGGSSQYRGSQSHGTGDSQNRESQRYGGGGSQYRDSQPYGGGGAMYRESQPYSGGSQSYRGSQPYSGSDSYRGGSQSYSGSQPYGQREPYNARGSSRRFRRSGPWSDEGSRYSESQYGMRRDRFDPYGGGAEPQFGEGPFADTSESPSYFGSGNYGDGGASYTGGFDQRSHTRYPGSLGQDSFSASDTRRYRTGPKGYTRSDERIREDLSERLMLADSIDSSEVSVTVKDGRVMLEGTVPTRSMKHAIEDMAEYIPGVQDVDNRIRVEREGRGENRESARSATPSSAVQTASGATPKTTTKQ